MIDTVAYVAIALVLIAYAWSARTKDLRWLSRANVLAAPFIALSAIVHHAVPSLVITVAFGCIGLLSLCSHSRTSR